MVISPVKLGNEKGSIFEQEGNESGLCVVCGNGMRKVKVSRK